MGATTKIIGNAIPNAFIKALNQRVTKFSTNPKFINVITKLMTKLMNIDIKNAKNTLAYFCSITIF